MRKRGRGEGRRRDLGSDAGIVKADGSAGTEKSQ